MLITQLAKLEEDITTTTTWALKEDLGAFDSEIACAEQDITAMLIPENEQAVATVITREDCIVCGVAWVNEVFKQLDASLKGTAKKTVKTSKELQNSISLSDVILLIILSYFCTC